MLKSKVFYLAVSLGALCAAAVLPAHAQTGIVSNVVTGPDYDSGAAAGQLSDGNFNTPESDGRPGVKFFAYGVQAFKKGDVTHAIRMYKVAASWAYKPAEYNLGVLYFKGEGVPVNRPLGAAWMVLAAERGEPQYVKARDLMVTLLTNTQFDETNELWSELKQTYGDKVALRRAKAQWAWVKSQQTGTRVGGGVGELKVGVLDVEHSPKPVTAGVTDASTLLQGGSIDGSIAYRQFRESDDPYSPILENRTGTVTVGPLAPLRANAATDKKSPKAAPPSSAGSQKPA